MLTCGRGSEGQLGIGKTKKELNFVKIENFNETIHEICSGINHTGLITSGKSVYVTGDNRFGQLGLGHKRNVYYYEKNLSLENASKISFGHHSSALINGKLFLFGTGVFGELLDPKILECQENIVDMKIGECSGIAISESKQL